MGKGRDILENMIAQTSLTADSVPGQSIVEIAGDKRVLIEGHHGVLGYSRKQIQIKVGYGCLCICGCRLEILHMTKEKLIITGIIESVHLHRRGCN